VIVLLLSGLRSGRLSEWSYKGIDGCMGLGRFREAGGGRTNARRVERPMPLVAPIKTAVRELVDGVLAKRVFEARISVRDTILMDLSIEED